MKRNSSKTHRKCTLLHLTPNGWHAWLFECGPRTRCVASTKGDPEKPLPKSFQKRALSFQPHEIIAWLPPERAFVRVLELPPCEPHEIPSMIELQLESLSPVPIAEIQWSWTELPSPNTEGRRILVLLMPKGAVEAALEQYEQIGCYADRLDYPWIFGLLEKPQEENAVQIWIYPTPEGALVLAGFWHAGKLEHALLIPLPQGEQAAPILRNLLQQALWAGELAGWYHASTPWFVTLSEENQALLRPVFESFGPERLEIQTDLQPSRLAERLAQQPTGLNLLPADKAQAYRQRSRSRAGLLIAQAALLIYLFGALGYLIVFNIQQFRLDETQMRVAQLYHAYTNALALKAQVQILQEQLDLRFAALDCLKAISEHLPPEMRLDYFQFSNGKTLSIQGTVPSDRQDRVTAFNEALARVTVNGRKLFRSVVTKTILVRGNAPARWNIVCELETPAPF